MHEVRCALTLNSGYADKSEDCGIGVYSESVFNSAYGCVEGASLVEAAAVCAADGARLCTVLEMAAGCTAGTGCGHDADLIWTGTECDPTPAKAIIAAGNSGNGNALPTACVPTDELHEVRCCSDVQLPGYADKTEACGMPVWTESDFASAYGCVHNANYGEATAVCAADGARMCTVAELEADCTAGTGCGHDADMIWGEPCSDAFVIIGNPTNNGLAADGNLAAACVDPFSTHEARCCSDFPIEGYSNKTEDCGYAVIRSQASLMASAACTMRLWPTTRPSALPTAHVCAR